MRRGKNDPDKGRLESGRTLGFLFVRKVFSWIGERAEEGDRRGGGAKRKKTYVTKQRCLPFENL